MKAIVIVATMLVAIGAAASDFTSRAMLAEDGTSLVVTEGTVRVPENRTAATSGSIELAVVRIARSATPSRTAHVLLAARKRG